MSFAKLSIFRTVSAMLRSREWGRGTTEQGLLGQSHPTPPRTTPHVDHSECAAKRTRSGAFAAFIQNLRSAGRDHDLKILARSRIGFDATPVRLNALVPTPKVRPIAPPIPPRVSPLPGRVATATIAIAMVAASLALPASPAAALSKHTYTSSFS